MTITILIIYFLLGGIYFAARPKPTHGILMVSYTVDYFVALVLWPLAVLIDVGCLLCNLIRRNK